jgi:diaminohydroxyphosphoribosylaminopyrimidine deaminase/5-amino-6-(5-phosphoribosylamino)uracil reductase
MTSDSAFMDHAIALSLRGRGRTSPNPNVGCVIVRDEAIVGRGWTQPGGRPHAEAMAMAQAGDKAKGATIYVTLEPCAHHSERGPACSDTIITAEPRRVVIAAEDCDPRTAGKGIAKLKAAGISVETGVGSEAAHQAMAGFFNRMTRRRPFVTLKLAISLDGRIALASGESRWITGATARAHGHLERAHSDAILVGSGTVRADNPRLDCRLSGLEDRSPQRVMLGSGPTPDGWLRISQPAAIANLDGVNWLLVEGGGGAAASFLRADLVDRILLYQAPLIIGSDGYPGIADLELTDLSAAHGRWACIDRRVLGDDSLSEFIRTRLK